MFTVLRCVAIIGLIFYFSPAREIGQPQPHGGDDRKPAQAPPAPVVVEAQDGAWNRLVGTLKEEAVRTAVNDKSLSDKALSAGLRMGETAARSLIAHPKPSEKPRLGEPEAVRTAQDASVRCVYRCDGTE